MIARVCQTGDKPNNDGSAMIELVIQKTNLTVLPKVGQIGLDDS